MILCAAARMGIRGNGGSRNKFIITIALTLKGFEK
jgi:hypothetical protein